MCGDMQCDVDQRLIFAHITVGQFNSYSLFLSDLDILEESAILALHLWVRSILDQKLMHHVTRNIYLSITGLV